MSEYITLPNGQIIAEIDVQGNCISGTGRAEAPMLAVPLQLRLRGPQTSGLSVDFREIRCRVSPFDTSYIAECRPALLNVRIESGKDVPNYCAYLEVPLDRTRLALLNRLRKGGDVRLRLDLEFLADELSEIGRSGGFPNTSVWGLKAHYHMHAKLQIVIPHSTWVENVLPGTEFAKIHIIELPAVPIENCAGLRASFDALQQAQKLESQGFYHEAIGKCRIALEPFFEQVEKTDDKGEKIKVPVLKSSWQTRLGKATYDWLNATLAALKGPANQALHLSSASFDQLETQIFLAVTTAVVAYAIKMVPPASS